MEQTLIACSCWWLHVFFPWTYLMFPAHCSIRLNHYTGLLSASIPPLVHPCIQSSEQTAVQPAQALSQSRWVVQTNHCYSPMLCLASVPAALTPSSLSVRTPCLTHSSDFFSSLPSQQPRLCLSSFPFPRTSLPFHTKMFALFLLFS